jgi:hypothetical protein
LISLNSDNFFSPEIQEFIFESGEDSLIFLHYTDSKETADSIIKKGFQFTSPFEKTTKYIIKNEDSLKYNHYILKLFGNYVIVISITQDIYQKYEHILNEKSIHSMEIEEILTDHKPYENTDNEKISTLHKKYIQGYFNYSTCEIIKNKDFNNKFDSPEFEINIQNFEKFES